MICYLLVMLIFSFLCFMPFFLPLLGFKLWQPYKRAKEAFIEAKFSWERRIVLRHPRRGFLAFFFLILFSLQCVFFSFFLPFDAYFTLLDETFIEENELEYVEWGAQLAALFGGLASALAGYAFVKQMPTTVFLRPAIRDLETGRITDQKKGGKTLFQQHLMVHALLCIPALIGLLTAFLMLGFTGILPEKAAFGVDENYSYTTAIRGGSFLVGLLAAATTSIGCVEMSTSMFRKLRKSDIWQPDPGSLGSVEPLEPEFFSEVLREAWRGILICILGFLAAMAGLYLIGAIG
jgi:hypothetical protein